MVTKALPSLAESQREPAQAPSSYYCGITHLTPRPSGARLSAGRPSPSFDDNAAAISARLGLLPPFILPTRFSPQHPGLNCMSQPGRDGPGRKIRSLQGCDSSNRPIGRLTPLKAASHDNGPAQPETNRLRTARCCIARKEVESGRRTKCCSVMTPPSKRCCSASRRHFREPNWCWEPLVVAHVGYISSVCSWFAASRTAVWHF
jgi:hypothetical protein